MDMHFSSLSTLEHRGGVSSGATASSLGEGQGSFYAYGVFHDDIK